jgi:hypothetical protein
MKQRHIPEEQRLQLHLSENLKCLKDKSCSAGLYFYQFVSAGKFNLSCVIYFTSTELLYLHNETVKMEAVGFYETPVNLYQTTRRHIIEHNILHIHLCERHRSIFSRLQDSIQGLQALFD